MPALGAGIHVFLWQSKTWMAGTGPAMTRKVMRDHKKACRHLRRQAFVCGKIPRTY
jgi:hypothetical protein